MNKILKKIKRISLLYGFSILLVSCDDFFKVPITETLNQDSIFNTMYNAEKALNAAYYLVPFNWNSSANVGDNGYRNDCKMMHDITATICDEAISSSSWSGAFLAYYGNGTVSPYTVGVNASVADKKSIEFIFEEPYYYFRRAFLFLENVDKVKDATPEWVSSTTAQAKLLIAIGYYELIRRHGSVPWVDKALSVNDDLNETRPPLRELIDKVDNLIEEAITSDLPDKIEQSDLNYGRVTKATAYFLRSRLWLLAASPLFNTDQPYLPFEHPEYICLGNGSDEEKRAVWKKAVDYTWDAINFCEKYYSMMQPKADATYIEASEVYRLAVRDLANNTEVIQFSRRIANSKGNKNNNTFFGRNMPPRKGALTGQSAFCCITQNLVDQYRTVDGSKPNYNSSNPWEKLDPRFHATVIHDQSIFGTAPALGTSEGDPYISGASSTGWMTGYFLKKFFHEDQYVNGNLAKDMPYIYMRLPELYLNYAEALNEYSPGDSNIEIYLNKTTQRAKMPWISLVGLDREQVRDMIIQERAVELAIEDQRYFDVKRWKIADKTIGATKYGVVRLGKATSPTRTYKRQVCPESRQTNWLDKYYLMPFPQYEILKEKGLVQNPGY